MGLYLRYLGVLAILSVVVLVPSLQYRYLYEHAKRFRVVTAGKFYRSGQLTEAGLEEVIRRHGIRTVINLQHENPDPLLAKPTTNKKRTESELCQANNCRYVLMTFDPFPREMKPGERPSVIDKFLNLMDDPSVYPVLIHCKAGLHRTGELTAVYRMEYEGWSKSEVSREIKANGFGDSACTTADDFIYNFLYKYQPGQRLTQPNATPHSPTITSGNGGRS